MRADRSERPRGRTLRRETAWDYRNSKLKQQNSNNETQTLLTLRNYSRADEELKRRPVVRLRSRPAASDHFELRGAKRCSRGFALSDLRVDASHQISRRAI